MMINMTEEELMEAGDKAMSLYSYRIALPYYEQAAEMGNAKAMTALANIYWEGMVVQPDIPKAVALYLQAAEAGDSTAMRKVGDLCYAGIDIDQDLEKTCYWYRRAVECGNFKAIYDNHGVFHKVDAIRLYKESVISKDLFRYLGDICVKAAENGSEEAINGIGDLCDAGYELEEHKKSVLMEKYRQLSDKKCKFIVMQHRSAGESLSPEEEDAVYFRQSLRLAERGNTLSMVKASLCYAQGIGIPLDYEKAAAWAEKTSASGGPYIWSLVWEFASALVGVHRIDHDNQKAFPWYLKSAEAGNVTAMQKLGEMYARGEFVERDIPRAMEWYEKAAAVSVQYDKYQLHGYDKRLDVSELIPPIRCYDNNYFSNAYYFADALESGKEIPQNMEKAWVWYIEAADTGDVNAMKRILRLLPESAENETSKILKWHKTSKKTKRIRAMLWIANYFYQRDKKRAFRWYFRAGYEGDPDAMMAAALMMETKDGIHRNPIKAQELYGKALRMYESFAEMGDLNAVNNIGIMYRGGHGVPQDSAKADMYFRKAASGENMDVNMDVSEPPLHSVSTLGHKQREGFPMFDMDDMRPEGYLRDTVIGIGKDGNTAINRLLEGDDILLKNGSVIDTDRRRLLESLAVNRIFLHDKAFDCIREIFEKFFCRMDYICLIVSSNDEDELQIAKTIGECAKAADILVVCIPIETTDSKRKWQDSEIKELEKSFDTVVLIPPNIATKEIPPTLVLSRTIHCLFDCMHEGLVGMDFADLKQLLQNSGKAFVGIGREIVDSEKIDELVCSTLRCYGKNPVAGLKPQKILLMVWSDEASMRQPYDIAEKIAEAMSPKENILYNASVDNTFFPNEMIVAMIATGFS